MGCRLCQGDDLDSGLVICTLLAMAGKLKRKKRSVAAVPAHDMSTGDAVVATLIAHGLNTLYALPGIHNDHLFDALHGAGERIRTIHTRHEQGAAYMALG